MDTTTTNLSYTPLPNQAQPDASPLGQRPPIKVFTYFLLVSPFIVFIICIQKVAQTPKITTTGIDDLQKPSSSSWPLYAPAIGEVDESSEPISVGKAEFYPWTNAMLSWQRTSYHFQPQNNWMNDPNGPLFHMGWYHFFYQYNSYSAIWGNMTWGHAVSKDLINWIHLPFAMIRDKWYDSYGVWTGSATILPDGKIVMLYTGKLNNLTEVQNVAYPANLSDPLLLDWVKYSGNPVMVPPPGIGYTDFRDPTTAWLGPDGKWHITIGSKIKNNGVSLVYQTTDFTSFELLDGLLHEVPGTGMWECIDFFPVSTTMTNGLETSANGPGIKHVLKASLSQYMQDFYSIGAYDLIKNKWTPDDPDLDVGIGLKLDYGRFYASKTFYDQNKERRIIWAWVAETDSVTSDLKKGWASLQTIPRTIVFDTKTRNSILQWPVEEVESLRSEIYEFNKVELAPGSLIPLTIGSATQLDIVATFDIDEEALQRTTEEDLRYNCSTSGGAANRGVLGPFGILVLAEESLSELTPVYFYIAKASKGSSNTHFCADQSRSSTASDVEKLVYGSEVPVVDDEKLSMRLLVDHSIVESYAQQGRRVITSRVYPTKAIDGAAQVYVFNNATGLSVTASLNVWQMTSAYFHPFPS